MQVTDSRDRYRYGGSIFVTKMTKSKPFTPIVIITVQEFVLLFLVS